MGREELFHTSLKMSSTQIYRKIKDLFNLSKQKIRIEKRIFIEVVVVNK